MNNLSYLTYFPALITFQPQGQTPIINLQNFKITKKKKRRSASSLENIGKNRRYIAESKLHLWCEEIEELHVYLFLAYFFYKSVFYNVNSLGDMGHLQDLK